jgi:hypothetical protein
MRTLRQQMRVQDGLRGGLQAHTLADDLVPSRHLPPQRLGLLVRDPDFGQEVAGIELCQHRCVDRISLDLGMRDQSHLPRIGDDHPADMRRDDFDYGCGIAGRLHHDMVVVRQSLGERSKMLARHADATQPDDLALVQHDRLGEHAVDIQSNDSHRSASFASLFTSRELAGNTATTDPRSQRIRASRRGGQITARAHSPWSKRRPARTCVLPVPHVPDGLTIMLVPRRVS